ncbi:MAG: hypothetical protein KC516_00710 [Nanoarchaeota archaeon]|nr:hypothetical protein [Nanoarchaeota archaeon]
MNFKKVYGVIGALILLSFAFIFVTSNFTSAGESGENSDLPVCQEGCNTATNYMVDQCRVNYEIGSGEYDTCIANAACQFVSCSLACDGIPTVAFQEAEELKSKKEII